MDLVEKVGLPFPFGYRHLLKAEIKTNRNRY